ncbi:hypothetical protein I7I48_11517 [Histoplasma ohiense]|nr:hypothetical protein I7I48_11517 [Histoplasma ohiense (nom. inval.)]
MYMYLGMYVCMYCTNMEPHSNMPRLAQAASAACEKREKGKGKKKKFEQSISKYLKDKQNDG